MLVRSACGCVSRRTRDVVTCDFIKHPFYSEQSVCIAKSLALTHAHPSLQAFGLTPQQMQQIGNNNSSSGKQHRRNISSPEQVVQSIREEAEKSE